MSPFGPLRTNPWSTGLHGLVCRLYPTKLLMPHDGQRTLIHHNSSPWALKWANNIAKCRVLTILPKVLSVKDYQLIWVWKQLYNLSTSTNNVDKVSCSRTHIGAHRGRTSLRSWIRQTYHCTTNVSNVSSPLKLVMLCITNKLFKASLA